MIALNIDVLSIVGLLLGVALVLTFATTIGDAELLIPVGWLRSSISTLVVVALGLLAVITGIAAIAQSFWYDSVNVITIVLGVIILAAVIVVWTYFAFIMIRNARYQMKERLRKKNGERLRQKVLRQSIC